MVQKFITNMYKRVVVGSNVQQKFPGVEKQVSDSNAGLITGPKCGLSALGI